MFGYDPIYRDGWVWGRGVEEKAKYGKHSYMLSCSWGLDELGNIGKMFFGVVRFMIKRI